MKPPAPDPLSRRRFVALVAAGSAALIAAPSGAGRIAAAAARPARPAPPERTLGAASRRELARQRRSTLETLRTLRAHPMPPGTEMAGIFRARRPAKRER